MTETERKTAQSREVERIIGDVIEEKLSVWRSSRLSSWTSRACGELAEKRLRAAGLLVGEPSEEQIELISEAEWRVESGARDE